MVDDLASAVGYLGGLIALLAGIYVTAHVNQHPDRRLIRAYLAGGLTFLGLSVMITAPTTLALTTPLDVWPNLTRMVGNIAAMFSAFCVLAMLIHTLRRGERARRLVRLHLVLLVLAVTTMIVLLSYAHTRTTVDFATTYANDAPAVAYQAIDVAYMCAGMIGLLWLIRRYVPRPGTPRIRGVLNANVVAAIGGLIWAAWKVTIVVLVEAGVYPVPPDVNAVSEIIAAVFIGIAGAGATLPAWLGWFDRRVARYRAMRQFRALERLWQVLTRIVPQVALGSGLEAGIDFALHRRVIEVRDAQLALRQHVNPAVRIAALQAAGRHQIPPGEDTDLLVEAAELGAAIIGHRMGTVYPVDEGTASQHTSTCQLSEVSWLIRLSRTLFASPVVAEIVRQTYPHATGSTSICGGR